MAAAARSRSASPRKGAGLVVGVRTKITSRGKMAFVQLDDGTTSLEVAVFNEIFEAERAKIEAQLAKAKKESEDARSKLGGARPAGDKPSGGSKPCNCPPGDPLCSCL